MTTCTCGNCGLTCDEDDLRVTLSETPDLDQRLDPGSVVPAGECPYCGCFTYLNPTTFTVLLRRPDYVTTDDNDANFMAQVDASNPTNAVAIARLQALDADDMTTDPNDYAVVVVFAGTHDDLNPER